MFFNPFYILVNSVACYFVENFYIYEESWFMIYYYINNYNIAYTI